MIESIHKKTFLLTFWYETIKSLYQKLQKTPEKRKKKFQTRNSVEISCQIQNSWSPNTTVRIIIFRQLKKGKWQIQCVGVRSGCSFWPGGTLVRWCGGGVPWCWPCCCLCRRGSAPNSKRKKVTRSKFQLDDHLAQENIDGLWWKVE